MSSRRADDSPNQRLALASVAASVFLALLKLEAARMSGSIALLGSALDAGLDIGVTAVTYVVVRVAERPADDDHHFGHFRLESLGTLMQTLVLFGVGGFVVHSAARQLTGGAMTMEMAQTPIAVATLAVSAGIDLWRSSALGRAARSAKSTVLAAAALSFRLDFLTTLVALGGLLTVGTGLQVADPIAAVVIGVVMVVSAVRILRETLDGMTDRAPEGMADAVRAIVAPVAGVEGVSAVRARRLGARVFIEVTILVNGERPFREIQAVKDAAMRAVASAVDGSNCVVIAEPLPLDSRGE